MSDRQIFQLGAGAILSTNVVPHQDPAGSIEAVKNTWEQVRQFNSGRKLYCFSIVQNATADPVVTEHLNQLGVTITWTRFNSGLFVGTASAAIFLVNKVPTIQRALVDPENHTTGYKMAEILRASDTQLYFYLQDSSGVGTDGITLSYFEIPVFY